MNVSIAIMREKPRGEGVRRLRRETGRYEKRAMDSVLTHKLTKPTDHSSNVDQMILLLGSNEV